MTEERETGRAGRSARLGVMGGTFDPVHVGHLIAATKALEAFDLDRVIFMPTGQPWQKTCYSNSEDRWLMAALAAVSHPNFAVSRLELDRKGATYTADTMQELRDFYGVKTRLYFIAGADAVLKIGTWRGVERLEGLTELIAVSRPGFELQSLEPAAGWPTIHFMDMPPVDVSATDIRRKVQEGLPIEDVVPAPVARYIRERGLYSPTVPKRAAERPREG